MWAWSLNLPCFGSADCTNIKCLDTGASGILFIYEHESMAFLVSLPGVQRMGMVMMMMAASAAPSVGSVN